MERKLYYQILKIVKIQWLATWVASLIASVTKWICLLLIHIGLGGRSTLSESDARTQLNYYSPKPAEQRNPELYPDTNYQLSIIVPAYNVERSIVRCLESALSQQTGIGYEIIVINDGSTDHTLEKLNTYRERIDDPRLKVVSQSNKGFSGARNAGIALAQGKYLMFLDSDDELSPGAIENLMKKALDEHAAIVAGGYETVYANGKSVKSSMPAQTFTMSEQDILEAKLSGFAWGKVFLRSLFAQVRFPEGYLFEDTIMLFLIYRLACGATVATIPETVYRYYKNDQGITATYHKKKKCVDGYWIVERMVEETIARHLPCDEMLFQLVYRHLALAYWRTFMVDKSVKEAIFILSCELMQKVMPFHLAQQDTRLDKALLSAYENRKFDQWKVLCALR